MYIHLNRLIPSTQTTTKNTSQDFLPYGQFITFTLSSSLSDTLLSEPAQTEPGTPIGHLSNRNSVNTSVDTRDTILAVDIGKDAKSRLRLNSRGSLFVTGDFGRLHTGTESHGSICLRNTTDNTPRDTGGEAPSSESPSMVSAPMVSWIFPPKRGTWSSLTQLPRKQKEELLLWLMPQSMPKFRIIGQFTSPFNRRLPTPWFFACAKTSKGDN